MWSRPTPVDVPLRARSLVTVTTELRNRSLGLATSRRRVRRSAPQLMKTLDTGVKGLPDSVNAGSERRDGYMFLAVAVLEVLWRLGR